VDKTDELFNFFLIRVGDSANVSEFLSTHETVATLKRKLFTIRVGALIAQLLGLLE
jgi:hypothetical protein